MIEIKIQAMEKDQEDARKTDRYEDTRKLSSFLTRSQASALLDTLQTTTENWLEINKIDQ